MRFDPRSVPTAAPVVCRMSHRERTAIWLGDKASVGSRKGSNAGACSHTARSLQNGARSDADGLVDHGALDRRGAIAAG